MTLFSSIQIANNALFAAQTGLQVTGNNIANANTPGYLRQRVVMTPAPTQTVGNLPLGLGVQVAGIVQQVDRFLTERLRSSISDLSQSETQESTYLQLESILGELGDTDLSTAFSRFFAAVHNVQNQPEDAAVRNLAAMQGRILSDDFQRIASRVQEAQKSVNHEIAATSSDINRLLKEIAELNIRVVVTEGGRTSGSDAVGLRDQREMALVKLAEIVGIRTAEQQDGSVTVFAGGDYLVASGEYRAVATSYSTDTATPLATIHIQDTDSPLFAGSGKLAGLYAARDEILGGFQGQLDELARSLVFEFNKLHSSGQGLGGYSSLVSEFAVSSATAALDHAGLPFTPVRGSFQVLVRNTISGETRSTQIPVDLNGLDEDSSLAEVAARLDAIDGIRCSITPDDRLRIAAEAADIEFGFAQDTSGLLAALGLNTFFTGSSAADIGVNAALRNDPHLFAASQHGFGEDADNAALLADFARRPLESRSGASLAEFYEQIVAETTQAAAVTQSVTEGFRMFRNTLEGQHLALSGVSIDDEVVNMITYQRVYQASARFIAAIGELLDVLVNL